MGGVQSKDPVVLPNRNESSIKFSAPVLNQLSQNLSSTDTTPEREAALDKHVRQRIAAEVAKLHSEEEEVKRALKEALHKENLGREHNLAGDNGDEESSKAGSRGTLSLSEDIDAVKKRVEKYTQRRALATESDSAVEESRKAVIQCYKKNPERPLECWKEVENFRKQVAGLENKFVDSLK